MIRYIGLIIFGIILAIVFAYAPAPYDLYVPIGLIVLAALVYYLPRLWKK